MSKVACTRKRDKDKEHKGVDLLLIPRARALCMRLLEPYSVPEMQRSRPLPPV